jgi:hypothetical protein
LKAFLAKIEKQHGKARRTWVMDPTGFAHLTRL